MRLPGIPQGKRPDEKEAAQRAANAGKLVEAGWIGLRAAWISDDAPAAQIEEMRNAFFAGAQHLFSTFMAMQDDGLEETPADLLRMEKLSDELVAFHEDFKQRRLKRPTMLMAAGVTGQPLAKTIAIDQIDRALRELSVAQGNRISPADIATVLIFPVTRIATHGTIDQGYAMVGALRTAVEVVEDAVAKKSKSEGASHAG